MVGTNWPHVPWPNDNGDNDPAKLVLPSSSIDTPATRQARAKYAHAVEKADKDLGMVYDTAREVLGDKTVFLFSGDHGAQWPFAKWNCYESGVKVPLIISWPGVTKPGTRTSAWVSWIDFLPTLIEVAGGKAPADIDGKSFVEVLRGAKQVHRDRIFTTHSGDGNWNIYPIRALREGQWKFILNLHPEFAFATHIDLPGELGRTKYWATWEKAAETSASAKAIVTRYHRRPAEELYDLATDPHEEHNLANDPAQQERKKAMRSEVEQWMKDQGDQEKVYGKPRLLSDPTSYGPHASSPESKPKKK
jgi:arylsulfatase A-like enzyme